jgi:hypothetical protein
MHRRSPLALLASLSLPIVAVAKAPEPVTLTQLSDCYMLQYKAPSLTPEARAKAETECKACLSSENKVKPGQRAQFALTVKDESTAKGACTTKAVAVFPTKVQTPGSNAALRCAALFEEHSSECQTCVNGGGAFVEWPEGKTECASKPKGPTVAKPAECTFSGAKANDCITCLFEKKKWSVASNACE